MTFFKEGDNPQPRTPATKCYAFTFGYELANGRATPCTAQGQKAVFAFGDTVDGIDTVPNGFAVPVFSKTHSGGIGVPVLAGGAIGAGDELIVGMSNFTIDGVVVSLPVALSITDAEAGDYVIGRAAMGSSTTTADTDITAPSIAWESYGEPYRVSGAAEAAATDTLTFEISLPLLANGDVITDWTPGYAGTIVSAKFRVLNAVTTAAKAATLNLEIDGVDVTGGVIALTSANATPAGKIINGTAITAGNTFDVDSVISIEASGVTTFIEGSGELILVVRVAA